MTHCYPRPPMRWNGAIGVIERCKRVSTVCVPKSRSKQELRSTCGEKPKAKGVSRPFKPYIKRVQDDSNPVPLLQSRRFGLIKKQWFTNIIQLRNRCPLRQNTFHLPAAYPRTDLAFL